MKEELQEALAAIKAEDETSAKIILARLLQKDPENVAAWLLLSKMAQTDVQKVAFLRKVITFDPGNVYARQTLADMGIDVEIGAEEASPAVTVAAPVQPVTPPAPDSFAEPELEPEEMAGEVVEGDVFEVEDTAVDYGAAVEDMYDLFDQADDVIPLEEEEIVMEAEADHGVQIYETVEDEEDVEATEEPGGIPVSEDPFDYEAQSEGASLPPWMADDEAVLEPRIAAEMATAEVEVEEAEVPEWLQTQPDDTWLEQENPQKGRVLWKPGQTEMAGMDEDAVEIEESTIVTRVQTDKTTSPSGPSGAAIAIAIAIAVVFLLLMYIVLT